MTLNNRLLCLLFSLLLFVSCSKSVTEKEQEPPTPVVEAIEISSFSFSKDLNASLDKDLVLEEHTDQFSGQLPGYLSRKLIPTFNSNAHKVLVNNIAQISGVTEVDFSAPVRYTFFGNNGAKREVTVLFDWFSFAIPHLAITIDEAKEVTEKETYLKATLRIAGNKLYPDYEGTTEIRGRGNSTWGYAKKPYRLKLTNKAQILGLPAAKNWVLLANYLDPSLMCNAVAMKIGRDLEVPFTNQIIPVDLTINGQYRGSYVLTQHLEVDENRINIGKDGTLFELDTYFDEEYKFRSAHYNLPIMIKAPELAAAAQIEPIKADFQTLEALIFAPSFPNNAYSDRLDINVLVKYMLVYFITGNEEINHPKSIYMHKKGGGKYSFGPIWDFDWAYGYEASGTHFTNADRSLFWTGRSAGTVFFNRLLQDPKVKAAFKTQWSSYKQASFASLLTFIDEYARLIQHSKAEDEKLWKKGKDFQQEVSKLKTYLQNRVIFLDSFVKDF